VRLLPLLPIIATLILAAPASAADVTHRNGPNVDFTVQPTDTVDLTVTGHALGDTTGATWTAAAGTTPLTASSGCSIIFTTGIVHCGVGPGGAYRFTTADRADKIDASGTQLPFDTSGPEQFDTAGGNDEIVAGPLADVVDAGAGDDHVTGGPGADHLHGDAGNDTFTGLTAGDIVDGGAGTDVLDLSAVAGGVAISLDGAANDGPLGANANVTAVEDLRGTASADLITGGAVPETLRGAAGDDTIDARGGGADTVECGAGNDTARVDETDVVSGCEAVERAAPPPPGGGGSAGAAGGGATALVDADGDGVVAGADCDDTRADIRPGARDRPGNRIDEDCSGADADFALVPARLSFEWLAGSDGTTRAATLRVRDVPKGGKVQLRCSGPGCAARVRTAKVKGGNANLLKLVSRRLRPGAVVEIRVTAPDFIGTLTRFKTRGNGRQPKKTTAQLAPSRRSDSLR
jgi:Ca2+-binding RTX toxin-like protein